MDGTLKTKEKWGAHVTASGFTIVPNHLLSINQFVQAEKMISPTEMLVLLQVLSAWWSAERLPFPSKITIAQRTGLSTRQVQRALAGLEEKGYLKRVARFSDNKSRKSNSYDLSQLVEEISRIAKENPKIFKSTIAEDVS
ncbi:helix-turn-helix domain-containing protein [Sphingomonas oligoaromativorans]|uniref:helix-turn-helix domain-containing protein n=1 Tax=Sphingomonas oligoaromativorans TaxID=575322 RepID=UPI001421FB1E|nr:helix-turn-helix domain-containing protein [Sphingomonas oligoaromativorans]NIJ35319.1 hypothetical protein [Sphingomonas oligoaromativorans]